MPITIKEIAELANVSRGTVDRALHGRPGVRADVRNRICTIAESLGYKPNTAARGLSQLRKKLVIGMLLPSIENPFFDELISGARKAESELADHGVELLLQEMHGYDIEEQVQLIDSLVSRGINIFAFLPFDDSKITNKIKNCEGEMLYASTLAVSKTCLVYLGSSVIRSFFRRMFA